MEVSAPRAPPSPVSPTTPPPVTSTTVCPFPLALLQYARHSCTLSLTNAHMHTCTYTHPHAHARATLCACPRFPAVDRVGVCGTNCDAHPPRPGEPTAAPVTPAPFSGALAAVGHGMAALLAACKPKVVLKVREGRFCVCACTWVCGFVCPRVCLRALVCVCVCARLFGRVWMRVHVWAVCRGALPLTRVRIYIRTSLSCRTPRECPHRRCLWSQL